MGRFRLACRYTAAPLSCEFHRILLLAPTGIRLPLGSTAALDVTYNFTLRIQGATTWPART